MFHGFRFITKSKNFPTDWCSTDPTVPSDGEKVVMHNKPPPLSKSAWSFIEEDARYVVKGTVFFFRGKVYASLTHSNLKKVFFFFREAGKKKQPNFGRFWHFGVFFFFTPQEKFTSHSLTQFGRLFFFPASEKKNTFFTHSLEYGQNFPKNKLFPGKKNSTFE